MSGGISIGPGIGLDRLAGGRVVATMRQVATRTMVNEVFNPSFTNANARAFHYFRSDVASFQVDFSNYYVDTGTLVGDGSEKGPGANASVTGTVYDPSTMEVLRRIQFSGADVGAIPDGGTLLSDPIPTPFANGGRVGIAWHIECPAGICFGIRSSSPGDGFEYGNILADKTSDPATITNASPGIGMLPHAIVALSAAPAIAILGDSRARGTADAGDTTGDQGNVARSIGPTIAYMNAGVPSDRGAFFNASHANRAKLAAWSTAIIWEYGINTIIGGAGAGADIVDDAHIARDLFPDKDFHVCTIEPYAPVSSDSYRTIAGQTVSAFNPAIVDANTLYRAGPAWVTGVLDIAASVESALNSGKYKADGVTPNLFTVDGLHGNAHANYNIQYDKRIDPARFGRPLPVPLVSQTGATESTASGRRILTYAASGTIVTNRLIKADALVVGGGGSGSIAGGGAGGYEEVADLFIASGEHHIVVGPGGTSVTAAFGTVGNKGSASSFLAIEAEGGGHGGSVNDHGGDGGSGGGAGASIGLSLAGGAASAGHDGGDVEPYGAPFAAAGGGGANGAGGDVTSATVAGNGGDGLQSAIEGTLRYYAGGGGGACFNPGTDGSGGLGGGGAGGATGIDGTDGLGGGGGGTRNGGLSGKGGSGVVVVSYQEP